jgi:hypothetical protein
MLWGEPAPALVGCHAAFFGCENFAKNVKNKKGIFCLNKICQNFQNRERKLIQKFSPHLDCDFSLVAAF